jgi:hypothetical protein
MPQFFDRRVNETLLGHTLQWSVQPGGRSTGDKGNQFIITTLGIDEGAVRTLFKNDRG